MVNFQAKACFVSQILWAKQPSIKRDSCGKKSNKGAWNVPQIRTKHTVPHIFCHLWYCECVSTTRNEPRTTSAELLRTKMLLYTTKGSTRASDNTVPVSYTHLTLPTILLV